MPDTVQSTLYSHLIFIIPSDVFIFNPHFIGGDEILKDSRILYQ